MRKSQARGRLRRLCYAALPVAAVLVVPGFYLMPNRKYAGPVQQADLLFQAGYAMALIGVVLAVGAVLILLLAED